MYDFVFSWMVNVVCPENTIYVGEKFLLQFKFSDDYPFKAPEVYNYY